MASLLLIHDLYPVPLEHRVLEALDTVGPTWSPTAATSSWSARGRRRPAGASQGSCNGCAASRATLELAIKQALDEHAPDLAGLEVEGVADATPGSALPMAQRRPAAPPYRAELPLRRPRRRGGASTPRTVARRLERGESAASTLVSPTSTARCSPTATSAPAAGRRSGGELAGACCAAGREVRLRPPRAGRRPGRAAAAEPGAAAARRAGCGWRVCSAPRERRLAQSRRRRRRGRANATLAADAAGAAAAPAPAGRRARALRPLQRDVPTTIATCSTSWSGGSSARARPAGRCARATRVPPDGDADVWLDGLRAATTSSGRRSRSRSGSLSSCAARSPAASSPLPEPGGRDRVRADPGGLEALVAAQPGARRARARRRGARRQPDVATRRSTRSSPIDQLLRARRADQVALGGDLRRLARSRRGAGVLRLARGARRSASERGGSARPSDDRRRRARARFAITRRRRTWRSRPPRRCCFAACGVRPHGRRGPVDRAARAGDDRSRAPRL